MQGYAQLWAALALAVVVACSTPRTQEAAAVGAPAASSLAEPGQPRPAAQVASEPPELHLEVLQERLAIGVSIQNRSTSPQRFAAQVRLVPQGHAGPAPVLGLSASQRCLTLRPGGEQLWPEDWGLTLAPDQKPIAALSGRYRFEIESCDDAEARVSSEEITLPVDYFVGGSTDDK